MNSKSFTLIELLVVIAIIGILASIVLIGLQEVRNQARLAEAQSFSHQVRTSLGLSLVGEWKLDEGMGIEARDSSGNDNHGILVNFSDPPDWMNNGMFGNALKFDGADDHIITGYTSDLTHDQTLEFWVKRHEVWPYSKPLFVNFNTYNSGDVLVSLRYNTYIRFRYGANDTGHVIQISLADMDQWYHVVWVHRAWNGSSHHYTVYRNGHKIADAYWPGQKTMVEPFYIGHLGKVTMDEVRIYNQALTTAEVQQLYAEIAARQGIVLK